MNRLIGRIQHYNWGGKTILPAILGMDNKEGLPCAEYWLGIHPGAQSKVLFSENAFTDLHTMIKSDSKRYLGERVAATFNRLPFLLKVLDVKDMLSIQVHPSKEQAVEGYSRENRLGIPLDAANRNYKDQNHKPEIMVALSDFWLLHGFAFDMEERISKFPILSEFKTDFTTGGIEMLYRKIMEMPQSDVDSILQPHADKILKEYENGLLKKDSPDYWAAKAIKTFQVVDGSFDRGIFSIYLFNILNLKPGEGIFQSAGMPHAYLEGQNVELMANSDNVLRAGLTNKHVDIPELLSVIEFVKTVPQPIHADLKNQHNHYGVFVPDFDLHSFHMNDGEKRILCFEGPSIIMLLSGKATISSQTTYETDGFDTFYAIPNESFQIQAISELNFFVATVSF